MNWDDVDHPNWQGRWGTQVSLESACDRLAMAEPFDQAAYDEAEVKVQQHITQWDRDAAAERIRRDGEAER